MFELFEAGLDRLPYELYAHCILLPEVAGPHVRLVVLDECIMLVDGCAQRTELVEEADYQAIDNFIERKTEINLFDLLELGIS